MTVGVLAAARRVLGVGEDRSGFVVRSPGRVNLIGDHIDYSGGLVLPMALDRGTTAVVFPRADDQLRGYSANFASSGIVGARLGETGKDNSHGWFSYALAVVDTAVAAGYRPTHGFDVYLEGNIPEGGGLSSSASVELAVAVALEHQFRWGLDPTQWAVLCQRAENGYIGVASGIMDQLAIARGREGMALLMDCSTLDCNFVPILSDQCAVVIANTRQPRQLASSAYNERRAAVDKAKTIIDASLPQPLPDLVSATTEQLEGAQTALREAGVWREARHSITEQARVVRAAEALAAGDMATMGRLMRESHESLRDDFRVTGEHLDSLVEAAWATPGVLGARMTGAGFGGCTVNLVKPEMVEAAAAQIAVRYESVTGITPDVFEVRASRGAHVEQ